MTPRTSGGKQCCGNDAQNDVQATQILGPLLKLAVSAAHAASSVKGPGALFFCIANSEHILTTIKSL